MVLFRLPYQDIFYTTEGKAQHPSVAFFSFLLTEFQGFYGDFREANEADWARLEALLPTKERPQELHKEDYLQQIEKSIQHIKKHQLQKLVIARKKVIPFEKRLHLKHTLHLLAKNYPSAFVYAFYKNDGSLWVGAFSEILGQYEHLTNTFQTMSLAGTLPINEKWTIKEIEEQKPVTTYLLDLLKRYSTRVEASETRDSVSGEIKHLRTDFKCHIPEAALEPLISELHPTPAVCGIPKGLCQDLIAEIEGFDREFYSGYSKIHFSGTTYYFVNLRCGKFYQNFAELFVGGGITALSKPEQEWQETELKAQNIVKSFVFREA